MSRSVWLVAISHSVGLSLEASKLQTLRVTFPLCVQVGGYIMPDPGEAIRDSFIESPATLDPDCGWGVQPMPLQHSYGSFDELGSTQQQQSATDVWSVVLEELSDDVTARCMSE